MQEIYSQIASLETKTCEIGISYLEVYNEMVRDLLCPGGKNLNILLNQARVLNSLKSHDCMFRGVDSISLL